MSDIEDDNYSVSSSDSNLSNNDENENEKSTFLAKKDKLLINQEFIKNIQYDDDDDYDDDEIVDDDENDIMSNDSDNELAEVNNDKNNIETNLKEKKKLIVFNESDDDYIDDNDDADSDDADDNDEMDVDKKNNDENLLIKSLKKNIGFHPEVNNDFENDSDNESQYEDENYLQKFSNEINKNYIMEFHPECINHNYDEIAAISKVTRDEFNIIIDPFHKTIPYLTKYEKTRVLGQRAKQIECGAKPLVKVPENIIDSYIIAELELQQKKIPFIIRRPIPGGGVEYWNLKDLENISF
jgi:DNA-directed RNA polymerase I, II, and III subunit RPABC2